MDRNRILFVALTNDIGSDRVVATMARHGLDCAVLSSPWAYASVSVGVSRRFALPHAFGVWRRALSVRRRLERAVRIWKPTIVLPLDDVAARLLRGLACSPKVSESLRDLLVASLGDPRGYDASLIRRDLMDLADRLGVRKPAHRVAVDGDALRQAAQDWGFPIVSKAENTCGGCGVSIIRDELGLMAALNKPAGLARRVLDAGKSRLRSWIGARAGFSRVEPTGALLQSYVEGKPGMCAVAAWNGQVLGVVSFLAERTHPEPTGSSTVVAPIDNDDMRMAARKLVRALGCHGFVSFDFIVDASGKAHLIEMNARAIGTAHLGAIFGSDVCALLAQKLGGTPEIRPRLSGKPAAVALYPKELVRDPDSPYLRRSDVMHDVPWQDAPVVAAYLELVKAAHAERADAIAQSVRAETLAAAEAANSAAPPVAWQREVSAVSLRG